MVDSVARDAHFAPLPGLWGAWPGCPPPLDPPVGKFTLRWGVKNVCSTLPPDRE